MTEGAETSTPAAAFASLEERREAAIRAPIGREFHRPDTRVIERPGWYQVVTPSAPRGMLNEVVRSELAEADADRVIDETVAIYREAGQPTKWCVGPWTRPAGFEALLARRGFTGWDVRGMGCATDLDVGSTRASVTVEEVTPDTLDAYLDTTLVGWGMGAEQVGPERAAHLDVFAEARRTAFFFSARVDGRVVGTAAILLRHGAGYLVGGVVLPEARGAGAYRALVAARLAFLRGRACGYAVTQAREATSAPILERLGFETLFRSTCWRLD